MSGAPSMLIHALRRPRADSWLFNLNNQMYTFLPDAEGRMVCEVTDSYHIQLLLDRPMSFRGLVEPEAPPTPAKPEASPPPPPAPKPPAKPPLDNASALAALREEIRRHRPAPVKGRR